MDSKEKDRRSQAIAENLKKLLVRLTFHNAVLGAFAPLEDEPRWFFSPNPYMAAYPSFIGGRTMAFRLCSYEELVEEECFGRRIPVPGGHRPVVVPDVLLVPGRAFDAQGRRLGRGGGFYDAYCQNFGGPSVGLCWHVQIAESVPCEEHDGCVDYVVTEEALYRKGGRFNLS